MSAAYLHGAVATNWMPALVYTPGCSGKEKLSRVAAQKVVRERLVRGSAYRCRFCDGWHTTHYPEGYKPNGGGVFRVALLAALMITPLRAYAAPPPVGSPDYAEMAPHKDWIENARNISGQVCCSIADGAPADVRELTPGHLQVFYDSKRWVQGTDQWVDVPKEAILRQPSPMFEPIAWFWHGRLRCLALASSS